MHSCLASHLFSKVVLQTIETDWRERKRMHPSPAAFFLLLFCLFSPTSCEKEDDKDVVGGVPMVDNSVRFALERCRQFLRLARFLRADAIRDDMDGIGEKGEPCKYKPTCINNSSCNTMMMTIINSSSRNTSSTATVVAATIIN